MKKKCKECEKLKKELENILIEKGYPYVHTLEQENAKLKNEYDLLQDELFGVERREKRLEADYLIVKNELYKNDKENSKLKEQLSDMEKSNAILKHNEITLMESNLGLQQQNEEFVLQKKYLIDRLDELRKSNNEMREAIKEFCDENYTCNNDKECPFNGIMCNTDKQQADNDREEAEKWWDSLNNIGTYKEIANKIGLNSPDYLFAKYTSNGQEAIIKYYQSNIKGWWCLHSLHPRHKRGGEDKG